MLICLVEQEKILKFSPSEDNEVEAIVGRNFLNGVTVYHIKWLDWPSVFNTWEPEDNLNNCDELLNAFKAKYPNPNSIVTQSKSVCAYRLREFAEKLNSVTPDEPPIDIINEVDSEAPPLNFQPVRIWKDRSLVGKIDETAVRLIAPLKQAIFECCSMCKCGSSCPFRVVQLGRKVPLTLFRTSNGRGWGVKTPQLIPKGTFVIEYVGEIISMNEAFRRGELYDREGQTYIFEIDYDLPSQFAIDNCHIGNASRFINHSCDPNLTIHHVFIDGASPKLPRIAFFAKKNIKEGEELTIDYQLELIDIDGTAKADSSNDVEEITSSFPLSLPIPLNQSSKCLCGSKKCRKYLA
nr:hypothetical transcript [Hymenolepis microstoma]